MVDVEDDDGQKHRQSHQDGGEEQKLAQQGQLQRSGWDHIHEEQLEETEWQENGDTDADLLPAVRRQVEGQDSQHVDTRTRDDEVYGVVQGLAADGDVESDVWVGLIAAWIKLDVLFGWYRDYIPLHALVVVVQIHSHIDHGLFVFTVYIPIYVSQVNLQGGGGGGGVGGRGQQQIK